MRMVQSLGKIVRREREREREREILQDKTLLIKLLTSACIVVGGSATTYVSAPVPTLK